MALSKLLRTNSSYPAAVIVPPIAPPTKAAAIGATTVSPTTGIRAVPNAATFAPPTAPAANANPLPAPTPTAFSF